MQNKPNFRRARMNVNLILTKDYRKKEDFKVRKNKPNFQKAKMNVNPYIPTDYEKETTLRPQKNKPNQSQFHLPQRRALSYAEGGKTEVRCRFSEVRYLSSAFCFLSSVHGHELVNRMKRKFMVLNCSVPIRCSCKRSFFYMTFLLKELNNWVTVPPIFDLTEELWGTLFYTY